MDSICKVCIHRFKCGIHYSENFSCNKFEKPKIKTYTYNSNEGKNFEFNELDKWMNDNLDNGWDNKSFTTKED